jgi:hypothetical protein
MQIEQIIGGLDGDVTAQAIQLRLRTGGQNFVGGTKLVAYNATGGGAVTLITIPSSVTNGAAGANILLTTPSFNLAMGQVPGFASDFTFTTPIPASYLSGGKLAFQSGSTIYWAVAFGAYTGSNAGDFTNDADGNFGAPTVAIPTNSLQGIRFTGAASAGSTTNLADYALTSNPAQVRNNSPTGSPFTVVPEPGSAAILGALGLAAVVISRRRFKAE